MALVGTNLWSSFLRESSKRSQSQESTCIVVGDECSGKRQLVNNVCSVTGEADNQVYRKDIVSYKYFDVDDKDLESSTRVNMWTFDNSVFGSAYDILRSNCKSDKLTFLLVLDLSKPEDCVASLQSWLLKINAYISKYHDGIGAEESKNIKASLFSYLRRARSTKGSVSKPTSEETTDGDQEDTAGDVESSFASEYFSLPIIVVGTKVDTVAVDSSADMKRAKEVQGRIRAICLEAGAALIYTSAAGTGATNCAELKKYLIHRLYPDQIGTELSLEDKVERCFIPAGFDTFDLIKISTGVKHVSEDFHAKFKADLIAKAAAGVGAEGTAAAEAAEDASSATTSSGEFKADIENEQAWLQGLHQFILQVSSSGAPSASASATHSRNPSDSSALATLAAAAGVPMGSSGGNGAGSAAAGGNGKEGGKEGGIAADGGEGGAAGIASDEPAPTGRATRSGAATAAPLGPRRQSTRTVTAPGEKKEVGDFFKNLLKK